MDIKAEAMRLFKIVEADRSKVRFWVRVLKVGDHMYPWTLHDGAIMIRDGLRELGYHAEFENTLPRIDTGWPTMQDRMLVADTVQIQIIIGGNCGTPATLATIPNGSIVYQLEQAGAKNHFTADYVGLLKRCVVWDYHPHNITMLKESLGIDAIFVPFSYVDAFDVAPKRGHKPEFDVIFLGAINPARAAILNELSVYGLKVFKEPCYDKERANMLMNSRVLLNVHFYQGLKVLEMCRLGIGMAAKKAVITQFDPDVKAEPFLLPGLVKAPYDQLVAETVKLCRDEARIARLGEEGFKLFSSRRAATVLEKALADTTVRRPHLPENFIRTTDPRLPVYKQIPGTRPVW